jgi:uncharacterized protein YbjT (DUF2867 family)
VKIFLTGGTGFVGTAVAEEIRRRGHAIRALVRDVERTSALRAAGAELVAGDVTDPRTLAGAVRGCDAVVHLVGIIRERGARTFEAVHVGGTQHVLVAAKEAGVRVFVHMSALGAKPAGTPYHRTKFEAEERVRGSGLAHVVFRPSIVFDRESPVVRIWRRQVRWLPLVPVLGDGRYRLQPVARRDVAAAFVAALEREETWNATYELVGPDVLTYDEILDAIGAALGTPRVRKAHLPLAAVRPALRLAAALHLPTPLTPDELQMLLEENVATQPGNALREVFGIEPVSFRAWVRELA